MLRVSDAQIEFDKRLLGAMTHVEGGIVTEAAQTIGTASQDAIKVDRFEVGFGGAGGERALINREMEDCGLEVDQAVPKLREGDNRKRAF